MKKIGILHGKERSFPQALIERINAMNEPGPAPAPPPVVAAPPVAAAPQVAYYPASPDVLPLQTWRDALDESPHLLIYGPSKAGKSTLAQAIVAMFQGCEYVVIDPMPNKPGESKWGGIDFVTLDEYGSDEYTSIKAALAAVQAEDQRRRKAMRVETFVPLVVIIDEVLQLVDALGSTKNAEGKSEPRMAQFIRTMGATARHRNIKIVLLGQGKNLSDLGLPSSTARNNYALIRVARNNATNERSAYIDAGGNEYAMDIRHVPMLAQSAANRARLWLSHRAMGQQETPDADELLSRIFDTGSFEPVTGKGGDGALSPAVTSAEPVTEGVELVDDEMIMALHAAGWSRNRIAAKMTTGNKQQRLDRIRSILGPA
jgi:RecA/RadA recombinase